jgi:hypothetical protein
MRLLIQPGLPDGLLSNQKSISGNFLEGLGIDNIDIFCGHLEYFSTIWHILVHFVVI